MADPDDKHRSSIRSNIRLATDALNRLHQRTPERSVDGVLRGGEAARQCKNVGGGTTAGGNTRLHKSPIAPMAPPTQNTNALEGWASAFRLLQSQVYNCVVELDTERVVRGNSMREMEQTMSGHVGELRAMVLQMKKENDYLTGIVRSLQKQLLTPSAGKGLGSGDHPALSPAVSKTETAVGGVPALMERLEALETVVARQQRTIGDRHTRLEGSIREMVGNAVNVEVERTRRIAREAARDCTDEFVRTHLASVQAVLQGERQHQQKADNAAGDAAREAVKQFRILEGDVQRRLHDMNSAIVAMRQQQTQQESEIQELSLRVAQDISIVEQTVEAARRELQSGIAKNAQASQARAEATQLALEAAVVERALAATKEAATNRAAVVDVAEAEVKQKEQQREEQRLLRRLEDAQRASEAVREQQEKLEVRLEELQDAVRGLQQQLTDASKTADATSADVAQWKLRIREALATSQEARTIAQESTACAQKTEDLMREALTRSGVQLKRVAADQEKSALLTQQLSEKLEATEARLASTRVGVDELNERHKNTMLPMSAKVESLHRTVQDFCGPKMEELSGSIVELRATVEQLQLNVSSRSKSDARQLSDMRHEYTTEIQQLKDGLQQQVREWKLECGAASCKLQSALDGIGDVIRLHEQSATRREALHASAAELAVLSDRLEALEASRETNEWRHARPERAPNLTTAVEGYLHATTGTSKEEPGAAVTSSIGRGEESVQKLDHHIAVAEQRIMNHVDNLQQQIRKDTLKDIERVEQLVNVMRDENASCMQTLRSQLTDQLETKWKGALLEAECTTQRQLQLQADRLREASDPAKLITSIDVDVELQKQLSFALQDAFAPRVATTESLMQLRCRLQKAEEELVEAKMHIKEQTEKIRAATPNTQKSIGETCIQGQGEGSAGEGSEMGMLLRLLQESMRQLQEEQASARREREMLQRASQMAGASNPAVGVAFGECLGGYRLGAPRGVSAESDWKAQLEGRIDAVEEKTEAAAQFTADTLDVLKQSIEHCVTLFVDEVNTSAQQNPSFIAIEGGHRKLDVDTVKGLDGVLLFLWQHQCGLQAAVQALQDGSLGTLDLLQHHEEQLALLQPVGPLATQTGAQLERLAKGLGVPLDPDSIDDDELLDEEDDDGELAGEEDRLVGGKEEQWSAGVRWSRM